LAIEWTYNRLDAPTFLVLDRLVRTIPDEFVISGVALTGAAAGDLIQHGGRAKYVRAQLRGTNPAITVAVGEITPDTVRVYSTAACTVDLYVRTQ
jgi:hypothetical protein